MRDVIEPWERNRAEQGLTGIRDVIVGRSEIVRVQVVPGKVNFVGVEFEVNYAEERGKEALDFYAVERWTFRRNAGVLSRGPEEIRTLSCPGCGSPVELEPDGTCTYCGRDAGTGAFHWVVSNVMVLQKSQKPPPPAGRSGGDEAGTERRTVFQRDFGTVRKAFQARHPDFSWKAFSGKVGHAFLELQKAWSEGEFGRARPHESDPLFNTHRFWIERFRKEGLTNRLEEVEIEKIQPCRIETDAFYEAITVRLFARMLDYTTNTAGELLEGSKTKKRGFSEYWTFVRRIGAKEGVEGGEESCPSCGGPVQVNMAGECGYCGSKVTTGDFDWVLSAIEQDEVYAG